MFSWVLKICSKFQVLIFSLFWGWQPAWWAKILQWENISTPPTSYVFLWLHVILSALLHAASQRWLVSTVTIASRPSQSKAGGWAAEAQQVAGCPSNQQQPQHKVFLNCYILHVNHKTQYALFSILVPCTWHTTKSYLLVQFIPTASRTEIPPISPVFGKESGVQLLSIETRKSLEQGSHQCP